ncbi:MAG: hypothetical protein ACI82F_004604, partial [Planctomycetota bacterium]
VQSCTRWPPLSSAQLALWRGAGHSASTRSERRRSRRSPADSSPTPSSIADGLPCSPSECPCPVQRTLACRQTRIPFELEARRLALLLQQPARRRPPCRRRIARVSGQFASVFLMSLRPVLASSPELPVRTCARMIPARSTWLDQPRCATCAFHAFHAIYAFHAFHAFHVLRAYLQPIRPPPQSTARCYR